MKSCQKENTTQHITSYLDRCVHLWLSSSVLEKSDIMTKIWKHNVDRMHCTVTTKTTTKKKTEAKFCRRWNVEKEFLIGWYVIYFLRIKEFFFGNEKEKKCQVRAKRKQIIYGNNGKLMSHISRDLYAKNCCRTIMRTVNFSF